MIINENQTIRQIKTQIVRDLAPLYHQQEAQQIAILVIEHFCKLSRAEQALQGTKPLSEKQKIAISNAIEKLKNAVPLQYIIGETEFYGRRFLVSDGVLIPRPETEELVEHVLNNLSKNKTLKILDIGTGSGIIAISLALELPNATVYASDFSDEALTLAKQNAKTLNANVHFIKHDIFTPLNCLPENLDCIVSNPPYVRESEKNRMHDNVLKHEPHSALFVNDKDALIYYRRIAEIAKTHLSPNGIIFCEINEALAVETKKCFEDSGFGNIFVSKDINNKDRIIQIEH
jgi:release factor glutamine methyltransferase